MPFGHVVKAHEDIVPARDKWKLVRKKGQKQWDL
jgi:hypothetical protein